MGEVSNWQGGTRLPAIDKEVGWLHTTYVIALFHFGYRAQKGDFPMTNSTRTWGLVLAFIIAVLCGGVATTASAGEKPGGDYYVGTYMGHGPKPEQQQNAHPLTAEDWDIIAYLETVCRDQLKRQRPNAVLEVGVDVVMNAGGALIGAAVGSNAAYGDQIDAGKQATYAGSAGGGSGLAAGLTGHWRANRYEIYNCVQQQAQWAQKADGKLQFVGFFLNIRSIPARSPKRPKETASEETRDGPPVVNDSTTTP